MFIIAGLYRHQSLISPKGTQTRPTASRAREALFNICQPSIADAHFLDLFAGSGAIGLEALSRGAASATFIESSVESVQCIQKNISQLQVKPLCHVFKGDVFSCLDRLEKQKKFFDIIFADPPYQTLLIPNEPYYSEAVVRWIDTHSLLAPGGLLFIEEHYNHQLILKDLKTLQLKNTRRLGEAALQQYLKFD
jgi:16S rRNA (guanine966-N2)-methyltransferase